MGNQLQTKMKNRHLQMIVRPRLSVSSLGGAEIAWRIEGLTRVRFCFCFLLGRPLVDQSVLVSSSVRGPVCFELPTILHVL
jgi:hypothetical protein